MVQDKHTRLLILGLVAVIGIFGIVFADFFFGDDFAMANYTGQAALKPTTAGPDEILIEPEVIRASNPAFREGILLLEFNPGVNEASAERVLNRFGGEEEGRIGNTRIVRVPAQAIENLQRALSEHPVIRFAEKDLLVPGLILPDDPNKGSQWHLNKVNMYEAWNISNPQANIIVANPDSGQRLAHPDLVNVYLADLAFNTVDDSSIVSDAFGHGTQTAGVLSAQTNNGVGIASATFGAKNIPLKISNSANGYAYFSDMAQAIYYAADNGAKVVSLSYDAAGSASVDSAGAYLRQRGGILFVAAGNTGSNRGFPNYQNMIVVSATTSSDTRPSWSDYGQYVDMSAPGVSIYTTSGNSGYGSVSGTSFSSPLAASVAAMLLENNPGLTPSQVQDLLYATAEDLGTAGYDQTYGHGRVDAFAALQAALDAPAPTPDTTSPSVNVVTPVQNAIVLESGNIVVGATDNVEVDRVELFINDQLYAQTAAQSGADTYTFYWDVSAYTNGNYTLRAKAIDTSNNVAQSSRGVILSKDVTPPTITITQPTQGATISDKFITISTSVSPNVASVDFFVDGAFIASDTSAPFSTRFNTRSYSQDTQLRATAYTATGVSASDDLSIVLGSTSGGKKGGGGGKGKNK